MRIRPEIKITLYYIGFGVLWILVSDEVIRLFPLTTQQWLQTVKGISYVSITGILLYMLLFRYYKELNRRIYKLERNERQLKDSEYKYKLLFESGPMPKWIFDIQTLQFLYVNEQAVRHYGYTREQFLSMTLKDIRPTDDIAKLEHAVKRAAHHGNNSFQGNFRHKKANGEIILVDIYSHAIEYKGRSAKIVVANDVTELINYINAIEAQNKKLQSIQWMQSHVVRAPLASLMGCAELLKDDYDTPEERVQVVNGILESAKRLDGIIKEISEHSEVVDPAGGSVPEE